MLAAAISRRNPQPEAFVVGELRVVFVVNKSNPIESLTFAEIRKALNEKGKRLHWPDIGGVGSAVVRCCGRAEKTWVRQFVQSKCMTRWRDTDQVGVRELQRLAFRDDVVSCGGRERGSYQGPEGRHALGFFARPGPLTEPRPPRREGLPIAVKEGDQAAPPLDLASERAYPLAEPLVLYVHPNAPVVARDTCKFATGPEAAKIVQQFGIWPEYPAEQARAEQRLAEVKAGKGKEIVVCDLTGRERAAERPGFGVCQGESGGAIEASGGECLGQRDWKGLQGGQ